MSGVSALDGLRITNSKDDLKFYHGLGSAASTVKEILDDYARLHEQKLPTTTQQLHEFLEADECTGNSVKWRQQTNINA